MDIEKERVAFEEMSTPNFNNVAFEINSEYPQGHYNEKSNHYDDLEEAFTLSISWFRWLERAELAHQETQALQEELNALKEKLKDGVIVPREPSEKLWDRLAYFHTHIIPDEALDEAKDVYAHMLEAVEKENE